MHEVVARVARKSGEDLRAGAHLDGVPPHVRQHGRLQSLHPPGQHAQAVRLLAVLDAGVEEHLHADADPEQWAQRAQPRRHDLRTPDSVEPGPRVVAA